MYIFLISYKIELSEQHNSNQDCILRGVGLLYVINQIFKGIWTENNDILTPVTLLKTEFI